MDEARKPASGDEAQNAATAEDAATQTERTGEDTSGFSISGVVTGPGLNIVPVPAPVPPPPPSSLDDSGTTGSNPYLMFPKHPPIVPE